MQVNENNMMTTFLAEKSYLVSH